MVFAIHDLIHLHIAPERSTTKDAYYRAIVRPAAQRAERVVTGSAFSQAQIVEWAAVPDDRVVVVGYGVADAFRPDGLRFDAGFPYVLYVGNSKPHKNLVRLVEAYARSGLLGQARLLMTGKAGAELAVRIRDLGLEDSIVHLGHVPDEDLPALYRGALAVAIPSLYEGVGLPALEALASGVPLVASNIPPLAEAAGDAAFLVDPLDVDEIADKLSWIATRPTEALEAMGRSAAATVSRWGPERFAQGVIEAIGLARPHRPHHKKATLLTTGTR